MMMPQKPYICWEMQKPKMLINLILRQQKLKIKRIKSMMKELINPQLFKVRPWSKKNQKRKYIRPYLITKNLSKKKKFLKKMSLLRVRKVRKNKPKRNKQKKKRKRALRKRNRSLKLKNQRKRYKIESLKKRYKRKL